MSDRTDNAPDWEGFGKAVLTDWPTGDLDGSVLFDLSLEYGMIEEVPGGYNSDKHIDADGIGPEEGDPWYEYTFRGEAGPGLYSIGDTIRRIKELEAQLAGQDLDVHPVEMAARIKELEAQLDQAMWETTHYDEQLKNMCNLFAKAEVKLAKAVEFTKIVEKCGNGPLWDLARTTIAELTGGKDE